MVAPVIAIAIVSLRRSRLQRAAEEIFSPHGKGLVFLSWSRIRIRPLNPRT